MEVAMATRNVSKQASALAKARERRRALDKARDDQDQRIEEATAAAMVALEVRAAAELALDAATGQVGEALKVLLAEDVSAEKAAALLELDVTEVRRLVKAAPAEAGGSDARPQVASKATVSVLPEAAGGEGAARRAG
jgi:vacuolar-type H+-ATPase subunit E/Vma4